METTGIIGLLYFPKLRVTFFGGLRLLNVEPWGFGTFQRFRVVDWSRPHGTERDSDYGVDPLKKPMCSLQNTPRMSTVNPHAFPTCKTQVQPFKTLLKPPRQNPGLTTRRL